MANSRNKGSKNERKVAELFTEWTGYKFARTPQSGGLHWKTKVTVGDIVCVDEMHGRRFPFSIECKFHAEVDFSYLIDETKSRKNNKILLFWQQALQEGKDANKVPLLFVRRNMMKANTHFIGMPTHFFQSVIIECNQDYPEMGTLEFSEPNGGTKVIFINSQDFFKWDYKKLYRLTRRINKNEQRT